jgi:hypothetical protein
MPTCIYDNTAGNWYKGSLHLHTIASDGHLTTEEMAGTGFTCGPSGGRRNSASIQFCTV